MMIELKKISKTYGRDGTGVNALCGISFSVMAGLQHPTEGEIVINGISIYKELDQNGLARLRGEYMGFVFQAFNLIPYLTALENVMLPLSPLRISARNKREAASNALSMVGMGNRAEHLPTELSGGQIQRTAIARALVNDPHFLFADEPTGNLDSATRDEIGELFAELNRKGRTIVMVTHDPDRIVGGNRYFNIKDGIVEEKQSVQSA